MTGREDNAPLTALPTPNIGTDAWGAEPAILSDSHFPNSVGRTDLCDYLDGLQVEEPAVPTHD